MNDTDSDSADLPKTEAWKCLRKRATSRQSLVAGEHHSDAFTVIMHHNMLSTILVLLALAAVATAFMPNAGRLARMSTGLNDFVLRDDDAKTRKSPDGRCYEKDLDVKGKCPGDPGYKPPIGNGKWCCMYFQSILKLHCFCSTCKFC